MPPALTVQDLSKTFGTRALFSGVGFSVDDRERLALIGPNGSGKSTLLKIIAGLETSDDGAVAFRKGTRAAYVAQDDAFPPESTVLSAVTGTLHDLRRAGLLPHFHDDHDADLAAEMTLERLDFTDLSQPTISLSGGQRKRLALARALSQEPDVLLLDEPTNHLDLDGIQWLESLLRQGQFASIVVTHDRTLLESVATRIVELSRAYPKGTLSVRGNYSEFLRRKTEFLDAQAKEQQSLATQVREDLRWLARGPQARRTKSKSRIDASYERIDELAELRTRNAPQRTAGIDFGATGRQTIKLIVARAITKALGGRTLFRDVNLVLSPGQVLGLLGPNGSGKSTFIKVVTGEIEPDPPTPEALKAAAEAVNLPPGTPPPGTVRHAEKLRIVTFSQTRAELDPGQSLREALSPQSDSVIFRGTPVHVIGWARRFLFTTEQLKAPLRALSGGERARVHIANLMLQSADVLVLDEPTNDLDIPSLEVLEENLEDFPGAVILVTHDRAMLARLATHILALDGRGQARHFTDYDQWSQANASAPPSPRSPGRGPRVFEGGEGSSAEGEVSAGDLPSNPIFGAPLTGRTKLSYKEQRELDQIEPALEAAEAALRAVESQMADPKVAQDHKRLDDLCRQLGEAQQKIASLYARWTELEAKKTGKG